LKDYRHVRLDYQPPASSTFLSEQISHQQPANSTFLSEQTSTSHQPPAKRTGCILFSTAGPKHKQGSLISKGSTYGEESMYLSAVSLFLN
jgi:hypothetical protein